MGDERPIGAGLAPDNQQRVIGACAVFMLMAAFSYSAQARMLWDRLNAGWASFLQFILHPWTQVVFFPLALIAVPLAMGLLISARRFYWVTFGWMGAYSGAALGGFVEELWYFRHPFVPFYAQHKSLHWFDLLTTWGWLIIPHFLCLCVPMLLLYLLLRARPISA